MTSRITFAALRYKTMPHASISCWRPANISALQSSYPGSQLEFIAMASHEEQMLAQQSETQTRKGPRRPKRRKQKSAAATPLQIEEEAHSVEVSVTPAAEKDRDSGRSVKTEENGETDLANRVAQVTVVDHKIWNRELPHRPKRQSQNLNPATSAQIEGEKPNVQPSAGKQKKNLKWSTEQDAYVDGVNPRNLDELVSLCSNIIPLPHL